MLQIAVWCLVVTALFAYINHRMIGLPTTIGVMTIAMAISLGLIGLDHLGLSAPRQYEQAMMASVDFPGVLMRGMLALLLFAGALHVDLARLRRLKWPVGALAIFGTTASALLVGLALWKILPLVDLHLPLAYCLVFGALISPTDAVAVAGVLKSAKVPKALEDIISGESLFNDAVGVVLFALALSMIKTGEIPAWHDGLLLLAREGGGGIVLGLLLGYLLYGLLRGVDSYEVEVLLTLATVMGGYGLADHLDCSGPLAMVVVGLVVGTKSRTRALPAGTRDHLERFWTLMDGLLNTVLFVLIGLEIVRVSFSLGILAAAAVTILITLTARAISVATPLSLLAVVLDLPSGGWRLLTWAGLRGGVSVALALSLPGGPEREVVLALTYCVVVFSILAQGLTIQRIACTLAARTESAQPPPT
ncbi:cation:proton antiporter [Zoogloea sp.]|uniref:cation:proton antiporter n=1 Tax=Zoogloea sp. TaxID=49181 RepID=UPI0035ADB0B5